MAPILILATARSGSTLLRLLLDTHPAICSPGELALGYLCETLYAAVEATIGPLRADDTMDARRQRCLAETRGIVDDLMRKYCEAKSKQRWCEKSTSNVDFLPVLQAVFPDAHYLCLHRHCLDVVRSAVEMYGESPWQMKEYLDRNHQDVLAAWIDRWCRHTELLLAFEAEHPRQSLRVTYEQLVADADAALQPVMTFIGVEWVRGLATRLYSVPHDLGRGDPKVAASAGVESDRVGRGSELDLYAVPEHLRLRMRSLLERLGYRAEPGPAASRDQPSPRVELTDVSELFTVHLPRRLSGYAHRLESGASTLAIIVAGPGGGAWTIQVDATGAHITPGSDGAELVVTVESADLLDVVNRRVTVAEFRTKVSVQGDARWFDRPFSERLMWVLFGVDFRPCVDEAAGAFEPTPAIESL